MSMRCARRETEDERTTERHDRTATRGVWSGGAMIESDGRDAGKRGARGEYGKAEKERATEVAGDMADARWTNKMNICISFRPPLARSRSRDFRAPPPPATFSRFCLSRIAIFCAKQFVHSPSPLHLRHECARETRSSPDHQHRELVPPRQIRLPTMFISSEFISLAVPRLSQDEHLQSQTIDAGELIGGEAGETICALRSRPSRLFPVTVFRATERCAIDGRRR